MPGDGSPAHSDWFQLSPNPAGHPSVTAPFQRLAVCRSIVPPRGGNGSVAYRCSGRKLEPKEWKGGLFFAEKVRARNVKGKIGAKREKRAKSAGRFDHNWSAAHLLKKDKIFAIFFKMKRIYSDELAEGDEGGEHARPGRGWTRPRVQQFGRADSHATPGRFSAHDPAGAGRGGAENCARGGRAPLGDEPSPPRAGGITVARCGRNGGECWGRRSRCN